MSESYDLPPEVAAAAADPDRDYGKYIRLETLGRGGMGVVIQAWDRTLRRMVALKFLETTSPEDIRRFQREAQLSGGLRHPNIVSVHEMGAVQGRPFIAMDYVKGHSLEKLGGKIPPRRLFAMMSKVCAALAYAHSKSIVHRDIKPHNIMVDGDRPDQVYIMDFGLAKIVNMDSSLSMSGVVMGTPQYMSPEQALGDPAAVDARTDLYSLGATMYFLLSGVPPVRGETPLQIVMKLHSEEPTPIRKLRPDLPVDAETIVMRCLAKDRDRRYPDANTLQQDLDLFVAGRPILSSAPSLTYRMGQRLKRHARWLLPAAILLVILAVAGIVARGKEVKAEAQQVQAEKSRKRVESIRQEALKTLQRARLEKSPEARRGRKDALLGAISSLNEALRLAPREADLYFLRAEASFLLWMGNAALPDYAKAFELDPKMGDALYRRIMVNFLQLHEGYDFGLALQLGRSPFAMTPFSVEFDPETVAQDLEKLRKIEHSEAKVRTVEGMLSLRGSDWESAVTAFEDARSKASLPEPIAFHAFARMLIQSGPDVRGQKSKEILDEFGDAISMEPNMPLYYVFRALALAGGPKDYALALQDLDQAIELVPDSSDLYVLRAYLGLSSDRPSQASEDARKGKELQTSNPRADMILAHIAWTSDRKDEAVQTVRTALAAHPDYAPLHGQLGIYLADRNEHKEAAAAFDRYLSLLPEEDRQAAAEKLSKFRAGLAGLEALEQAFDAERMAGRARQLAAEGNAEEALGAYRMLLFRLGPVDRGKPIQGLSDSRRKELIVEGNLYAAKALAAKKDPQCMSHVASAASAGFRDFEALRSSPEFSQMLRDPELGANAARVLKEIEGGKPIPRRPGMRKKEPPP